ncbi:MAG: HipA domain-containing protein [Janthinobacterium lividum]
MSSQAPDGHAKNFSLQLLAGAAGSFRMTPMYDVMSAFPVIGNGPNQWVAQDIELAMALLGKNRHYQIHTLQRRHFNSTARKVGYGENAERLLQELIVRTPEVVAKVRTGLPVGFSEQVADKVLNGLLASANALEAMSPD